MDGTAAALDGAAITVDHARNLLALIGMNQKNDFVMSHVELAPYGLTAVAPWAKARSKKQ